MLSTRFAGPMRILIADDYDIFRQGLVTILSRHPEVSIVGQASNGVELVEMAERQIPDIIITDIQMPLMNGIEAVSIISKTFPEIGIIALTNHDRTALVRDMLAAGARGYLLKSAHEEELLDAIIAVHKKDHYYCNTTLARLMSHEFQEPSPDATHPSFTNKEKEVIRLICRQHSNKEIASILDTTLRSVESARERIQHKIGARNMAGIVAHAIQAGIILLSEM